MLYLNDLQSLPESSLIQLDGLLRISLRSNKLCSLSDDFIAWAEARTRFVGETTDQYCGDAITAKKPYGKFDAKYLAVTTIAGNSLKINFVISMPSVTSIDVYDTKGIMVANLLHEYRGAGTHFILWENYHLASGIYTIRLKSTDEYSTAVFRLAQ